MDLVDFSINIDDRMLKPICVYISSWNLNGTTGQDGRWPGAGPGHDVGPFGDSYFATLTEAYEFVMQVKQQLEDGFSPPNPIDVITIFARNPQYANCSLACLYCHVHDIECADYGETEDTS